MAFVETVISIVSEAQAEILIFLIAICAHALLFSGHRIGKSKCSVEKPPPSAQTAARREGEASPTGRIVRAAPTALVRAVQAALATNSGRDRLAAEITTHTAAAPKELKADILSSLLSAVGKAVTRDLLAACDQVVGELEISPTVQLYEGLLRGHVLLRQRGRFDAVYAEAEAAFGALPCFAVLALRSAIHAADAEAAFAKLPTLAIAWKSQSPSVAHGQLFIQLVRFSTENNNLPKLLEELQGLGMFVPWTVASLLNECANLEDKSSLAKVRQLAAERGVELNCGAHAALVRAAGTAQAALSALDEAAAAGCAGREVLLATLSCASRFDDRTLADAAAARLPGAATPHDVVDGLIQLFAKGGKFEDPDADEIVLRLYSERAGASDVTMDAQTEWLVADAALRTGRHGVLGKVVARAGEGARQIALFKTFTNQGRFQDCVSAFRACPQKTSGLCNAVLDACIDCGDLKLAEQLMAEASDSELADVVTYNTMIKAHLRKGDMTRARAAISAMRSAGLQPNSVTFNELIDWTIRDRPDRVWTLIDEMKACGCKPNQVTCSIVLKSIGKSSRASDIEKALLVVDEMEEPMDEVLMSSVCEACIRSGRADLLRKHLQRQRTNKNLHIKGAHTYGSMIRAYGSLNEMDEVWDSWREMRKRHVIPTSVTIGCMVEALATNGHVDAGYELIREQLQDPAIRPMVNAVIYCSVLKGFSHGKRFDRVWSVYEEMKAERLQFSIVTYNTLVDACARSGDMGRIPALLEEMAAQGIEPNVITYSAIVKGYCQENRLDRAFELLEDMKKTKNFSPDEVTYNTLIDGCARYGLWDRGMAVLEEMESSGVSPSAFTLSVLVKLANRSKRPDKAFELVESLCAKYRIRLCVQVLNNLIHACTAHGDLPRGLGVLQQMLRERIRPDSRTYMLLLRGCIGAKATLDAFGLLRAAGGVAGGHPRLASFSASAAMPKGGLPAPVVSEALEGIADVCGDEALALQLLCDLRKASGIALDPKLPMRLTSKAMRKPYGTRAAAH